MSAGVQPRGSAVVVPLITAIGRAGHAAGHGLTAGLRYFGGAAYLFYDAGRWLVRALLLRRVRMGWSSLAAQMVRVGVRSVPIVVLLQAFIGIILTLQIAPILKSYSSLERTADIVAVAMFRELGPLLSAVVLSGFAGASIAAEIGAMVESEEIKALRAHALDPIRFLVLPRFLATVIMLTGLTVVADVVGVFGGLLTSWWLLHLNAANYLESTRLALVYKDFFTGLSKAVVFGVLISMIACYEGLKVSGGAEGVGRATTATVVKSIVALIATDCIFTTAFYLLGW